MRLKHRISVRALAAVLLVCAMLPLGVLAPGALSLTDSFSAPYENSRYHTELSEIIPTGDPVDDLIRVALSQQGYHEGDSLIDLGGGNGAGTENYTEYGWWYGKVAGSGFSGYWSEWSGAFLSWCARQAGVSQKVFPTYAAASVFRSAFPFTPAGTNSPRRGDIVFFRDGDKLVQHVGLVFSVTQYELMTVEGDADGEVRVCEYYLDDVSLLGYGRPSYYPEGADESSSSSAATAPLTIEQLRNKFPAGRYWNGGDPDKTTKTPCTHHKTTGCSYYGGCFCNVFYNSVSNCIQCQGFSMKMGYDAYGINPYLWQQDTDPAALYRLKPGDIIRYKNNGHTIFVLGVKDDTITYADCNNDYQCVIRWDATVTIEKVAKTFSYVRVAPFALNSNGLAVQFNANGGTVPGSEKQTVYTSLYDKGLNMRSGAGVGYSLVGNIPKNGRFLVTATAKGGGYTWGKTTYNGVTGWVVISVTSWVTKNVSRISDCYVGASGTVYSSVDNAIVFQSLKYGTEYTSGLKSAADLGIVRDGYEFVGWSTTQTGTEIFKAGTSITAEKIQPATYAGTQTVVLYAVWRTMTPEVGTIVPSVEKATAGDTVKFTLNCANATKYDISVSNGTKTVASVSGTTSKTLTCKLPEAGTYIVTGRAYNSYGSTAAGTITFTVAAPQYLLSFAPNGGTISGGDTKVDMLTVVTDNGIRLREKAGTYDWVKILAVIPCGVSVPATEYKETATYRWAKVTYQGIEGWIAYYNLAQKVPYAESEVANFPDYLIDDGVICDALTGQAFTLPLTDTARQAGLPDASAFCLTQEGATFVGWSLKPDGGTVFAPNTPITLNVTGATNVTLYAIWENDTQYGDVNGDGTINIMDMAIMRNFLANQLPDKEGGIGDSADVNADGKINLLDLALMRQYLATLDPVTGRSEVTFG